ncbi:uncharacterized protein LOC128276381 [Anopheles cruzii]|uniref:uncharacterized protein LOC128276381 n=1 Tax=Anopheles cruzii TaxID=68878 RepID=UPI0022EC65AD|nr:uncharacterized protein LOC128276381 [Anopheles cruzii]
MKRLLLALLVTMIVCAALQENGNQTMEDSSYKHCASLDTVPSRLTAIMAMMGTWYGSELITHDGPEEGIMQYRNCPVVNLTHVAKPVGGTKKPNKEIYGYIRYLEMFWSEAEHSLKFTLSYDSMRHTFWMALEPPTGFMPRWYNNQQYNQFTGVIQVVKSTDNLLVLTFCHTTPGQLFTVVLQRDPPTDRVSETIRSIPNLLHKHGLPNYSVRKMCDTSYGPPDQVGSTNGTAGPAMGSLHVLLVLAAVLFSV